MTENGDWRACATARLEFLKGQRDSLRLDIQAVTVEIRQISSALDVSLRNPLETLGSLTGCIRQIVQEDSTLNPQQVREQLRERGFDLEKYSQPLACIQTVMKRVGSQWKSQKGQKGRK